MKDIFKLGLILFSFSLISAILLAFTYQATLEPITQSRAAADLEARKQVFPEADEFTAIEEGKLSVIKQSQPAILEIHEAKSGGNVVGYVVKSSANGFGGKLEVVIGTDPEGKLKGIRLGNNSETPGLGDNAKKPEFYEQFVDKTIMNPIGVNKGTPGTNEIQAMTGATVTSKAVTQAINLVKAVIEGVK